MKRITLEPWTAFDKHCLTSAVSRVGDQNWTAVSRQTKNIYEECNKYLTFGEKKPEWFSNKQCAAQYEHLLKNVPPRRKKRTEREQGGASESPAEILQQASRHEFIEELKRTIAEEQAMYLKLYKEYEDIKAGRLDHKLEEIQEEYDAKEREKEIKLKLKFKLGEKSQAEASAADHDRPTPPADTPTTPVKVEKEVSHEPHKTSVTTSPLLTSLLQSPSPLTRPSSATPTISLLLNSSPSVPSNESPTLSRLLESSCPTPSSSQQPSNATNQRLMSTPQTPRPQLTPSTPLSVPAPDLPNPVSIPPIIAPTPTLASQLVAVNLPNLDSPTETATELSKETVAEIAALQEELMQTAETLVSDKTKINPIPFNLGGAAGNMLDEKKRGVPRRLDLENIEAEEEESTESQVLETVEEMIEKVQTAIIETVGDSNGNEGSNQDLATVAESETTTTEDHSLDTLELTNDAVQLIVVGPDHPPSYEVNVKDEGSKDDAPEDVPDIDEIQPSLLASDIAEIHPVEEANPSEEPTPKEETVEDIRSPPVTIEQAEADLASITREEENDAGDTVPEAEVDVPVKEEIPDKVDDPVNTESVEPIETAEAESTELPEPEKQEEKVEDEVVEQVANEDNTVEAKEPVASKEQEDEETVVCEQKKSESEDEDDAHERESIASRQPVEVDDVTTGTENTSDRESDVSEEEKKEEEPPPPPVPEVEIEKQKPLEKPVIITEEKPDIVTEEKVEEIRSAKRELRRGRATPPVTSTTVLSERTLREKRPTTPSSLSDGREEPTPRTTKRKRTTNVSESSIPCSPSPSIVSNDDDKDYKIWKKSILLVYDRIAAHKYASVFLKPINESDAPSYFQMIKCPTDLTTIKRHIESGLIRNTVDFQKEMLLMISNAMIYNKSDTLIHKMACEMLPDMKEAMETMVQALGSGVPLDQPDSRPPPTARVSRASVSAKGQGTEDMSGTPTAGPGLAKRKRQPPPEETRSKRKRSDAS